MKKWIKTAWENIKEFFITLWDEIVGIKRRCVDEATPKFWKRVRNLCAGLSAAGGTILARPDLYPEFLQENVGYLLTAGLVGTVLSQLTKHNERSSKSYSQRMKNVRARQKAPKPSKINQINQNGINKNA
jgi:hypothetical protein